jgi:hypothetical protein
MSLLAKAAAKSQSRKPREVEELLALIQRDKSTTISVPEAMKVKAAFMEIGTKLPYFEDPSDLVEHLFELLN